MIPAIISFVIGVYFGRWWALFITMSYFVATQLLDDFMGHSGIFGPVPPLNDLSSRIRSLILALILTALGVLIHKAAKQIRSRFHRSL